MNPPEITTQAKRKLENQQEPQKKRRQLSMRTFYQTTPSLRLVAGGEVALVDPAPIKKNINLGRAQGHGSVGCGRHTLPREGVLMTTSLMEKYKTNDRSGNENEHTVVMGNMTEMSDHTIDDDKVRPAIENKNMGLSIETKHSLTNVVTTP